MSGKAANPNKSSKSSSAKKTSVKRSGKKGARKVGPTQGADGKKMGDGYRR